MKSLAQRLEDLEQRTAQREANVNPNVEAKRKAFDEAGFLRLVHAFNVMRSRPKLTTPRADVVERVAERYREGNQTARFLGRAERTEAEIAEIAEREADQLLAMPDAEWHEHHREVYGRGGMSPSGFET